MRLSRCIAEYAAAAMSITILTIIAPPTMIAQQAPGMDDHLPISLTTGYTASVRLGASAREIDGDHRIVPFTTTLRTYRPSHNYSVGLDSATASRMRQRLTHTAIGAVGGAAIGAAIGALAAVRPAGQDCHDLCSNRGFGVVYIGAVGLLTGAIIGAVWPTH